MGGHQYVKDAVMQALGILLAPLVDFLMNNGVSARDSIELLRRLYVLGAQKYMPEGVEPGKINVTLVSARTGLARSQVRRILRGASHKQGAAERGGHRGERVLAGWWHDRDFRDSRGQPRILKISKGPKSFAELCGRHGGEQQQYPMILKDLEKAGVVRVLPRDRVQVLRRNYAAVSATDAGITAMFEQLAEHLETLFHNLLHPDEGEQFICRRVSNPKVKPEYAKILAPRMAEAITSQLETFSDALTDPMHTASPLDPGGEHLSITTYMTRKPAIQRPPVLEAKKPASGSQRKQLSRRTSRPPAKADR